MSIYNSEDAEAYGMLDILVTFIARWEMYSESTKKRFKELTGDAMGVNDRAHQAAIGQFCAQLDYIIDIENSVE